jgi:hypothetical protein
MKAINAVGRDGPTLTVRAGSTLPARTAQESPDHAHVATPRSPRTVRRPTRAAAPRRAIGRVDTA